MRTASSKSHPCPKCSGETVSFSTATTTAAFSLAKGGSCGGIFLRRALIAAAFSTENGACCSFLSVGERLQRPVSLSYSSSSSSSFAVNYINKTTFLVFFCKQCVILLQNIMFLVQKRLFCILPCNKSTIHLSSYEICSLFSSFSTAKDQISDHKSNFTVVNSLQSCELSSEKAAKTTKCCTCHTKSSSSSLSVEFFKQSGWSDAQVVKLMQRDPRVLRANVETILKPRMRSLQDMGFSDTEIVQLVSSCPCLLHLRDIQTRINFWRSLLGSNERLIKACRRSMFLLASSLSRKIEPSISLLRECGISEQRIAQMVVERPSFFCRTNKCIGESIKHVEEMGVSRDCKMFPHALLTVMTMSRSNDRDCGVFLGERRQQRRHLPPSSSFRCGVFHEERWMLRLPLRRRTV
ncbi:unnamed protein product, partial [Musa hybrid cultivar]